MFRITNENLRPTEWGRRALWMSVLFPFTLMAVGGVYDVLPCESVNKANSARFAGCPVGRDAKWPGLPPWSSHRLPKGQTVRGTVRDVGGRSPNAPTFPHLEHWQGGPLGCGTQCHGPHLTFPPERRICTSPRSGTGLVLPLRYQLLSGFFVCDCLHARNAVFAFLACDIPFIK
ncbi:hypothetical protein SAMN04488118_107120 [Epibacterium ulvae]|uniref:Uncharacterized protein n=1 Tax=Epibacterium ulvae TaxID=1156985 RepID=A0A1G5R118_9RHOB|nr:hypothetical protein SAMN04488118_107120 [Epibacterium ulvae]